MIDACTFTDRKALNRVGKVLMCKYKCMHIPTKKIIDREDSFNSEHEFMTEINHWNGQQPGVWLYYY